MTDLWKSADLGKLLEDKVWVNVECTIQARSYEPVKISMGQSQTLLPEDNPDEVRIRLCRKLLKDVISEGETVRAQGSDYLETKTKVPQGRPSRRKFEG